MRRHIQRQKGATVVEYALMLALVAIAVAVITPNIASAVVNVFSKAASVMSSNPNIPGQTITTADAERSAPAPATLPEPPKPLR